jgi:hypothetical protein
MCQYLDAICAVSGIGLLFVTIPVEPARMTGERKDIETLKIGD